MHSTPGIDMTSGSTNGIAIGTGIAYAAKAAKRIITLTLSAGTASSGRSLRESQCGCKRKLDNLIVFVDRNG